MAKLPYFLCMVCVLATLTGAPAQAREISDPVIRKLLALDLEGLGKVRVVTAGRETTTILEAPVVVTVITAEDFKEWGVKTPKEARERATGYYFVQAWDERESSYAKA